MDSTSLHEPEAGTAAVGILTAFSLPRVGLQSKFGFETEWMKTCRPRGTSSAQIRLKKQPVSGHSRLHNPLDNPPANREVRKDRSMALDVHHTYLDSIIKKTESKTLTAGVVGLGYVGLPLAHLFTAQGFRVVGFDIDATKVQKLTRGESYIRHLPEATIREMREDDRFTAVSDFSQISRLDAISICVPTPLDKAKQPDLTAVRRTTESLVPFLRAGQLVILDSTTYPCTTTEVMLPILQKTGLKIGEELFVGYSPEREDPGNPHFSARAIPKVVGANDPNSRRALEAFYGAAFDTIVPVSSCEVAEMVKVLENIYRCVNVALVNELKLLCQRMNLNVWEVIDAAKTKPFGFQAFYPGPGLGGHCIPIDPFYLSWKAREYDFRTKFIELAGEVNISMPYHVVNSVSSALNWFRKSLNGAKVLVLGIAYKKDIDDLRESPSLTIIELLLNKGAIVQYNDPHIPVLPRMRRWPDLHMT